MPNFCVYDLKAVSGDEYLEFRDCKDLYVDRDAE